MSTFFNRVVSNNIHHIIAWTIGSVQNLEVIESISAWSTFALLTFGECQVGWNNILLSYNTNSSYSSVKMCNIWSRRNENEFKIIFDVYFFQSLTTAYLSCKGNEVNLIRHFFEVFLILMCDNFKEYRDTTGRSLEELGWVMENKSLFFMTPNYHMLIILVTGNFEM